MEGSQWLEPAVNMQAIHVVVTVGTDNQTIQSCQKKSSTMRGFLIDGVVSYLRLIVAGALGTTCVGEQTNLEQDVWSKRGQTSLSLRKNSSWRKKLSRNQQTSLARATWSKAPIKSRTSYLVKSTRQVWHELFGQSGQKRQTSLARAIWSKAPDKSGASHSAKSTKQVWC